MATNHTERAEEALRLIEELASRHPRIYVSNDDADRILALAEPPKREPNA
jgi:hypothetical protein